MEVISTKLDQILTRLDTLEQRQDILHSQYRSLRNELIGGTTEGNEECVCIAEDKTIREIVDKIAWDVEKIHEKVTTNSCQAESVKIDPDGIAESAPCTVLEEEIHLDGIYSLPGAKVEATRSREKRASFRSVFSEKCATTNFGATDDLKSRARMGIANCGISFRMVNLSSFRLVDKVVYLKQGIFRGERDRMAVEHRGEDTFSAISNYYFWISDSNFISYKIQGTNMRLIINFIRDGHIYLQFMPDSVSLPKKSREVDSILKNLVAIHGNRSCLDKCNWPMFPGGSHKIIASASGLICEAVCRCVDEKLHIICCCLVYRSPVRTQMEIWLRERDIGVPFTFTNLKHSFDPAAKGPGKTVLYDIANLSNTSLIEEKLVLSDKDTSSVTSEYQVRIVPGSRNVFSGLCDIWGKQVLVYKLDETDLKLLLYTEILDGYTAFGICFLRERVKISRTLCTKLTEKNKGILVRDINFVQVCNVPKALTLQERNVRVWACMNCDAKPRLKIVFYTVP